MEPGPINQLVKAAFRRDVNAADIRTATLARECRSTGGKLLILWPGRKRAVRLGVVDDVGEQLLAHRGQSALP